MSSSKRRRHQKHPSQSGYSNEYTHEEMSSENGDILTESENTEPEPVKTAPVPKQSRMELDRIGDILRRARQERGEALHTISDYLRIRPSFLSALEHSRYDELPADAYVIGFLRTYADYLKLNTKAAIDMYRKEMAGRRKKPQLSMPQPISEGKAPTVAIMIIAFIAALLIYAVWYGFATSDRAVVTAPSPQISVSSTENAPTTENTVVIPPITIPAESGAITAVPASNTQPTISETMVDKAPTNVTKTTSTIQPVSTESLADGITISSPEPLAQVTREPAVQENPLATQNTQKPLVFGNTSSRSRIVVRTEKESWLLIADRKGNTVFDRIMKPGEIYNVPFIEGLTLTTGNGGGIILNVDGKDLPRLSAESRVVRAVLLDPERLRERATAE